MKKRLIFPLLWLALALTGCANLKVVRDYANESAKLSAYTELTAHYRDTYRRERPYLDLETDEGERATDAKRQAAYDDLINIHQCITGYMQTLAKLAGEDSFSLSPGVSTMAASIKQVPELGISDDHVDAYAQVVQVITRWATSAKQEKAVRDMVEAADPGIQKLLSGMRTLVRLYQKTNQNERAMVLGLFESQVPFTNEPKDVLLNRLVRVHLQLKTDEYEQVEQMYAKADQALAAVATGHQRLREGLSHLSGEDLKASLGQAVKDIKAIRESLKKQAVSKFIESPLEGNHGA